MSCCSIFYHAQKHLAPWQITVATAFSCSVIGSAVALLAALIAKIVHLIQSYRLSRAEKQFFRYRDEENKLKSSVHFWQRASMHLLALAIPLIGGVNFGMYVYRNRIRYRYHSRH